MTDDSRPRAARHGPPGDRQPARLTGAGGDHDGASRDGDGALDDVSRGDGSASGGLPPDGPPPGGPPPDDGGDDCPERDIERLRLFRALVLAAVAVLRLIRSL